ncbi:MAG: type II secretion system protein GspD [Deltaproteobacteria bacterium GWC2_65_14]|nr:MAG: type II secretion system protein GspD [Deltaproteobacteria bacterium GWC2_65_14]
MRKMVLAAAALWLITSGARAAEESPPAGQSPPAVQTPTSTEVQSPPAVQTPTSPEAGTPSAGPPPAAPATQGEAPIPESPAPGPAADNQSQPTPRTPVYLSMDFTDVDLPVLIKFISEQTKKNFIFDERVQGKITIISPRRITLEEAYNVFLSVLHVKGFATVEQENTIKIVLMRDAKQESMPTEREGSDAPGSKVVTRLIPLQYVDVGDVVALLTPMISKDGLLTSFPTSNLLIVIDSRSNIDRLMKILAELDQEGTGSTLRIFPLRHASAAEVARMLDSLYQQAGAPQVPGARGRVLPGRARGNVPKFLPDTRTNSLLALAVPDVLNDVEDLIRRLDIPTPENTGKINVYYLENATAEETAKVLSSLSDSSSAARSTVPGQPPGTIKGVITAELEGGVKITADKATNSLIVIASPNDYQTLVEVIKKLDIRRRQVYVEALVMEINLDKGRDLGVEFRGAAETGRSGAVLGGTNFDFQGNLNALLASLATGNPLLFSGTGLIAAGIAGNVVLPDGTEIPAITAVLRAAQSRDNVNVLSSPHLLTLDNKEAEIIIAENIPFITSQSRDSTNLANVINTVERKDVGIILRITPHIHESEFVNLEIYQESSAVKGDTLLALSTVGPTTTKRSAKTSVLVKNGDTVVIGGMMQETFNKLERKIPLLGDIPLLGNLFKFQSVSRKKTNLLLFLTPRVIVNPADMTKITGDQQGRMDRFIEQHKGEIERIFPERAPTEKP